MIILHRPLPGSFPDSLAVLNLLNLIANADEKVALLSREMSQYSNECEGERIAAFYSALSDTKLKPGHLDSFSDLLLFR